MWADRDDLDDLRESMRGRRSSQDGAPLPGLSGSEARDLTILDSNVLIDALRDREPALYVS